METKPAYEYAAFVCSPHTPEQRGWAEWLVKALETFRTPRALVQRGTPAKIGRLFHEDETASGDPELDGRVRVALWQAQHLIIICTVEMPPCERVRAKIELFKQWGRSNHIITLLVANPPNALIPTELQHWLAIGTGPDTTIEPVWVSAPQHAITEEERNQLLSDRLAAVLLDCDFTDIRDQARSARLSEMEVDYFESQVRRWGVPEGVRPVAEHAVLRRNRSLRFESRDGLVRRVVRIDASGVPQDDAAGTAQWDVFYRPDGTIQSVEHRNRYGEVRLTENFSLDRRTVNLVHGATLPPGAETMTADIGKQPAGSGSEAVIVRHLLDYDSRGFVTAVHYNADRSGTPAHDAAGNYGEVYDRNHRGQARLTGYLDRNGLECELKNGVANRQNIFAPDGRLVRYTLLGADGQPVLASEGFATEQFACDDWGNITGCTYLGVSGEPVTHCEGYARVTRRYDALGNEIEWACFDADGEAVLCEAGYARKTHSYDMAGNEIEWACAGTDGRPVLSKGGYARATQTYDARGNIVEWACFGTRGEPVLDIYGVARITLRYDAHGNVIEWAFFGTKGEPVLDRQGVARVTQSFDGQGNLKETARFDIYGMPVGEINSVMHRQELRGVQN